MDGRPSRYRSAPQRQRVSLRRAWSSPKTERLRCHPSLLSRLTEEVDAGGSELRQGTIWEVLRTRSVLDGTTRHTKKRIRLGDWVIPENTAVVLSIRLAHASEESFPDAASFNPDRFVGASAPKPFAWIPFGRGVNRCIGGVGQHGDGRHPAHTAARIAFRGNRCAGRTASLPRCGDRARTGRPSRGLPADREGVERR
jgi:hypothetical protein